MNKKHTFLLESIHRLCGSEKIELAEIGIEDPIVTDDSMNRENDKGEIEQLNGDFGTVTDANGRKGKIVLTIDFRPTTEIIYPGQN